MKHEITAWYQRDTHDWKPTYDGFSHCHQEHVPSCTYTVRSRAEYQELKVYARDLLEFAAEIHRHEPAWG